MMRAVLGASLLGLLALGAAVFIRLAPRPIALDRFGEAPAFQLVDQLERPVNSEQLRGRVILANFVYTSCRDICPLLTAQMRGLQSRLAAEGLLGGQVQLLSFTVDPTRDTPAVLRRYAEQYAARPEFWRFLTGPEDQVVPLVVQGFRLGVDILPPKEEATGDGHGGDSHVDYEVIHSGRFVLIDREWQIRALYDGRELDVDRVVRDIKTLAG